MELHRRHFLQRVAATFGLAVVGDQILSPGSVVIPVAEPLTNRMGMTTAALRAVRFDIVEQIQAAARAELSITEDLMVLDHLRKAQIEVVEKHLSLTEIG